MLESRDKVKALYIHYQCQKQDFGVCTCNFIKKERTSPFAAFVVLMTYIERLLRMTSLKPLITWKTKFFISPLP